MKILLLIALISLPLLGCADKLTGSWKEVRRCDVSGKEIPYTDTLRIQFKVGNEYLWMRPAAFQYRGTYTLSGSMLDLGIRELQVVISTKAKLVLKDEGGTYELAPYTEAPAGEDNRAAANSERANTNIEETGIRSAAQLAGRWEVYKRTNSGKKMVIDYSRILKTVVINAGGGGGELYAAEDMQGKPSWTIDQLVDNLLYCEGRDDRILKVVSCSPTELIIQEGTITYFFKQFKG